MISNTSIKTIDEAAYKIASDQDTIKGWALIAHSLGYGWCAGTGTGYVGGDFSTQRIAPNTYRVSANCNPRDPKPASAPKWETRLQMTFDNFTQLLDTSKMNFKRPIVTRFEPIVDSELYVYNFQDKEITAKKTISVTLVNTITHVTQHSFKNSISVKQKWNVGIPGLLSNESELQYTFESNNGWSDSKTTTETITNIGEVTVTVPPRSKVAIRSFVIKTSKKVHYEAEVIYDYHVTLFGFLRYDWNARRQLNGERVKHNGYSVIGRPNYSYKFGTEKLSAVEHLTESIRTAPYDNVSPWNIEACRGHEDGHGVFKHQPALAAKKHNFKFSGTFENVYAADFFYKCYNPEPLSTADWMSEESNISQRRNPSEHIRPIIKDIPVEQKISVIWTEHNGNHILRSDGTIVRRDGSLLSSKSAQKFIKDKKLQKILTASNGV